MYATRINDGWEHRSVEVEKRPNYTTKQWEFTRMDTGEIYKTKAMSFDDLQVAFPFLDAEKLNNSAPEEAQDQPDDGGMLNGKMSTVSGFVPQPRIPELTTATE